ncbi:MAG TPA: hypothetical protein EYH06_10495 [Chromatiales bacterium]|nr:hypothetical protein [Thiotrichales bacterium]HIP68996.1 hypothetical protein [Chromatiales bacterium]
MKKILFLLFTIALLAVVYFFWPGDGQKKTIKLTDMPWQIEQTDQGHTRVFGIELGKTNLWDLIESWKGLQPDIGLFTSKNQHKRLEAYLGNRRLGLFDAKIILGLGASQEELDTFSADDINVKPMPTGAYKQEISEAHLEQAFGFPITSITYIPKVKYDAELLEKYFSQPQSRKPLKDGGAFWLYPGHGLVVLLDPDGKEVFHYVNREDFPSLVKRLEQENEFQPIQEDGLPE